MLFTTLVPLIAFISGTIAAGSDGMVLVKRHHRNATTTVTKTVFRTVTVAPTSTSMSTSSTIAAAKTFSTSTSSSVQQASSTSTAVSSNQSGAPDSLQFAALKTHNDFRNLHGANALNWNATLVAAAQKWANGCQFKHSGGTLGPYGENLAALSGANTISAGIQLWNDEAKDYTPDNPNYSHFTQVVWKASTQLGCAVTACDGIFPPQYGKAQYYVCEYFPQGNVYPASNFQKNVQP